MISYINEFHGRKSFKYNLIRNKRIYTGKISYISKLYNKKFY